MEFFDRELTIEVRANPYPSYFMNVLRESLVTLISDRWPWLNGKYKLTVPCPGSHRKEARAPAAFRSTHFKSAGERAGKPPIATNAVPITASTICLWALAPPLRRCRESPQM